jgi:hypothetical protein
LEGSRRASWKVRSRPLHIQGAGGPNPRLYKTSPTGGSGQSFFRPRSGLPAPETTRPNHIFLNFVPPLHRPIVRGKWCPVPFFESINKDPQGPRRKGIRPTSRSIPTADTRRSNPLFRYGTVPQARQLSKSPFHLKETIRVPLCARSDDRRHGLFGRLLCVRGELHQKETKGDWTDAWQAH